MSVWESKEKREIEKDNIQNHIHTLTHSVRCPGYLVEKGISNSVKGLIFVRYLDQVLYNRASSLAMKPQVREAVGWLVYECEAYVTLTWGSRR